MGENPVYPLDILRKKTLRRKGIRSWNLRLRRHLGAATVGRASDCSSAAALPSRRLSHPRPWTRPGPVCPPRPLVRLRLPQAAAAAGAFASACFKPPRLPGHSPSLPLRAGFTPHRPSVAPGSASRPVSRRCRNPLASLLTSTRGTPRTRLRLVLPLLRPLRL